MEGGKYTMRQTIGSLEEESFKPRLRIGLLALYVTMALTSISCHSWRDFVDIHLTVGRIALVKGDTGAAEAAFEKALEIQEAHLEDDAAITTRQQLVELYQRTDNYGKVNALLKRAIEIEAKSHGEIHEHVITARDQMAQFYMKVGAFDEAERLFKENAEVAKRRIPQLERVTFHNLGGFYLANGQFEKAKPLLERVVELSENPHDLQEKYVLYDALTLLGDVYLATGKAGVAELVLLRALDLLVVDDAKRRDGLQRLAKLYIEEGKYEKGKGVLLEALRLSAFYWGDHLNDDFPDDLTRLSALYYRQHNYKKAQELLDRSLQIKLLLHGPHHTDVKMLLVKLAVITAENREYSSALGYFEKAFAIENQHITDIFSFTSEAQKLDFIRTLSGLHNQFMSLFYQQLRPERRYYNRIFEYLLQRKGVVLDAQSMHEESLRSRLTGKALALWEERSRLRGEQAHLMLHGNENSLEFEEVHHQLREVEERLATESGVPQERYNQQSLKRAYEHVEALSRPPIAKTREQAQLRGRLTPLLLQGGEKMDAANIEELKIVRKRLLELEEHPKGDETKATETEKSAVRPRHSITTGNIQNALPQGSALIEFIKFLNLDWTGRDVLHLPINEHYVAWVLTPKGDLHFIDLGDAEQIDVVVRRVIRDMHLVAELYTNGEIPRPDDPVVLRSRENLMELSNKLWKKELSALLGGVDKLLLSPDGELNRVPFSALLDRHGEYLINKYSEITYVTSGADILRAGLPRAEPEQALFLVANPDYDYHGGMQRRNSKILQAEGGRQRLFFPALPHTEREAEIISPLVSGGEHQKHILTRDRATKAAVKAARRPRVLHLATHGFFLEEEAAEFRGKDARAGWTARYVDVLARGGLALTGANHGANQSGEDNGLLTALEVTGMDLSGTDLVVLSACDTGIGKNETGEGVFGLRRAFALAGAKNLLMSLWPVFDEHTANEMKAFYTYRQTLSPAQALHEAQRDTINNLEKQYGVASPALWASFILQGTEHLVEGSHEAK